MIVGLAGSLPGTLQPRAGGAGRAAGRRAPASRTCRRSGCCSPRFLGYNPMQQLLGPRRCTHLTHRQARLPDRALVLPGADLGAVLGRAARGLRLRDRRLPDRRGGVAGSAAAATCTAWRAGPRGRGWRRRAGAGRRRRLTRRHCARVSRQSGAVASPLPGGRTMATASLARRDAHHRHAPRHPETRGTTLAAEAAQRADRPAPGPDRPLRGHARDIAAAVRHARERRAARSRCAAAATTVAPAGRWPKAA